MNLETIRNVAARLDGKSIAAFVHTARVVIDAVAAEREQALSESAPQPIDYATARHDHAAPPGGPLSVGELRARSAEMVQAIAAEKWVDGFVSCLQLLAAVGAI